MLKIKRTDSGDPDFKNLVLLLDRDLQIRDGDEHAFFAKFNKTDNIPYVTVGYLGDKPVACGAIKAYAPDIAEVKRIFVLPEYRGKRLAGKILKELERWASELEYQELILETGLAQPEAIRLYEKSAYGLIPNYGQYAGVESSRCFKKRLNSGK